MKKLLSYKKPLLVAADILLIPSVFFFRWLSGRMLARVTVCSWAVFGGKCVTCGGTHFVNSLLSGRIAEAFAHNQFLFLLGIDLAVSYLLLNLHWLAGWPVAQKILKKMYNIPMLIVGCAVLLLFFFLRNIPVFCKILEYLFP